MGWENRPRDLCVESFEDADSLLQAHTDAPFDIIFLDVVMPLLGGIEAAREIRQFDKNVKIVFLTTSPDFAVDSYTVKANNYLLKPVVPEVLFRCLDELYEEIRQQEQYIAIRSGTMVHSVRVQDIEYVEAQNKQVLFSLVDGRGIQSLEPLHAWEDKLLQTGEFYKCHRSYMVNMYHIETYTLKEIKMRSGCRIPISRSCHKSFEAAYFALLFGKAGDE